MTRFSSCHRGWRKQPWTQVHFLRSSAIVVTVVLALLLGNEVVSAENNAGEGPSHHPGNSTSSSSSSNSSSTQLVNSNASSLSAAMMEKEKGGVDAADMTTTTREKVAKNVIVFARKKQQAKSKLSGGGSVKVDSGPASLSSSSSSSSTTSSGFVAEWDYVASPNNSKPMKAVSGFPSQRLGPGTWQDALGNWWLFGGHQPGMGSSGGNEEKTHSSSFLRGLAGGSPHYLSDLWRYSKRAAKWTLIYRPEISRRNNGTRTTSPPPNITFPLLCGSSAADSSKLLVYPTTTNTAAASTASGENNFLSFPSIWIYDTQLSSWTSHSCNSGESNKNATEYCPRTKASSTLGWCTPQGLGLLQVSPGSLNLHEFAPLSPQLPQWTQLATINISSKVQNLLESGSCRVVSTNNSLSFYILCPSPHLPLLDRALLLVNPSQGSVKLLGNIHLNNAFTDKKVWHPGRSSLTAISTSQNLSLITLAYHKLLDLWVHDLTNDHLYPLENLWKGDTLREFQTHSNFYPLSLSLADKLGGESHWNSSLFFMPNHRNKLASFQTSPGHFRISVLPDKSVFLPPRDAPLLNASLEEEEEAEHEERKVAAISLPLVLKSNNELHNNINHTSVVSSESPSTASNDQSSTITSRSTSTKETWTEMASSSAPSSSSLPAVVEKKQQQLPPRLMMMMTMKQNTVSGGGSNKILMSPGKRAKLSVSSTSTNLPHLSTTSQTEEEILTSTISVVPELVKTTATTPTTTVGTISTEHYGGGGYQNDDYRPVHGSGPEQVGNHASEPVVMWGNNQSAEEMNSASATAAQNIDPKIFFALTLSFFGSIGLITFVRRCVKCPIAREDGEPSILSQESRESLQRNNNVGFLIPGDTMPYHTPLV